MNITDNISLTGNHVNPGTYEVHEFEFEINGLTRTFKWKKRISKDPFPPKRKPRAKYTKVSMPIAHDHPDLALLPNEDFSGPEWQFDPVEFDAHFADMPSFDA